MTRIAGEVIGGVELDTVTIGITQVQIERVGDSVSPGAAFDVLELVGRAKRVGQVEDVMRLGTGKSEVVQPWR